MIVVNPIIFIIVNLLLSKHLESQIIDYDNII